MYDWTVDGRVTDPNVWIITSSSLFEQLELVPA